VSIRSPLVLKHTETTAFSAPRYIDFGFGLFDFGRSEMIVRMPYEWIWILWPVESALRLTAFVLRHQMCFGLSVVRDEDEALRHSLFKNNFTSLMPTERKRRPPSEQRGSKAKGARRSVSRLSAYNNPFTSSSYPRLCMSISSACCFATAC